MESNSKQKTHRQIRTKRLNQPHFVSELFDENDLAQYTELIQQLSYYALTPGEAKNMSPEKLLNLQRTSIELVSGLAKIYETYHNYTAHKQIS